MTNQFIKDKNPVPFRLLSALEQLHGIRDEKVEHKYAKELERREEAAQKHGRRVHPLHRKILRMPKLSSQYIRTIRNHLYVKMSIMALLPAFTQTLTGYLRP
jgi:hypothetical protein